MGAARPGVVILPAVIFLALLALCAADAFFMRLRLRPIGQHVVKWTRNYPLWLFLLSGVVGAMLGHFFWKPAP